VLSCDAVQYYDAQCQDERPAGAAGVAQNLGPDAFAGPHTGMDRHNLRLSHVFKYAQPVLEAHP
jgi:hypothetical protein